MKALFLLMLVVLLTGCSLINSEIVGIEKNKRPVYAVEFRKDIDACYQEWESLEPGVTNVGGSLVFVEDPKVFKEKRDRAVWKCLQERKGYKAKK